MSGSFLLVSSVQVCSSNSTKHANATTALRLAPCLTQAQDFSPCSVGRLCAPAALGCTSAALGFSCKANRKNAKQA